MKRLALTCIMIFCTLAVGRAKDFSDLFDEFRTEQRADYVSVSPLMMKMARMFTPAREGGEILHRIHSVRVLDLEECAPEVKQRFNREIDGISTKGYEEMMRVKEEGELVRIFVKHDKDIIQEMVILCVGHDDCTLVALTGKIRQKDIQKIVDEQLKDDDTYER